MPHLAEPPVPGRQRAALHAALLATQAWMLLFFASSWSILHGFSLDDAWIHQVVARTFARTGTLGYAAGQHGAGATSYLWATLLAVNYRAVHADPVVFTLALNVALSLVCGQLLLCVLLRARPPELSPRAHSLFAVASAALGCFGGTFLWFAYSGMECNLVIAFVLAGTWFYVVPSGCDRATDRLASSWGAVGAGLAAAGLALTRPDAASFGPFLVVLTPLIGRRWRDAGIVAALWCLGIATYVGSNLYATGAIAPATLEGRRWLWLEGYTGLSRPAIAWEFASDWLLRLRNYTLGTSATAAFWISVGLAAYGVVGWIRARNTTALLVLGWAVVHIATYLVLMPTAGHGGRYQPLVPLLFLTAVGAGSLALIERLARARWWLAGPSGSARLSPPRTQAGVASIVVLASITPWAALVAVGVRDWREYHAKAVSHVRATECALGEAINGLPEGATVASFDIGCSGFTARRPILDIGGLSAAKTADLLKQGRIWEYLRDQNVAYVGLPLAFGDATADPLNFADRLVLVDNPAVELEPLRYFQSPMDVWQPGASATDHAAPRQGLFRVRYTGRLGPPDVVPSRAPAPEVDDPKRLIRARVRPQVDDQVRVMAGAGVRVHFAIGATENAAPEGDTWVVHLAASGISVTPRTAPRAIDAEVARAMLAGAARPYLDARDFGGAAQSALHAIAALERRSGNARFFPRLPAVPPPSRDPDPTTPRETVVWGAPLAAGWLALALLLERLAAEGSAGVRSAWDRARGAVGRLTSRLLARTFESADAVAPRADGG